MIINHKITDFVFEGLYLIGFRKLWELSLGILFENFLLDFKIYFLSSISPQNCWNIECFYKLETHKIWSDKHTGAARGIFCPDMNTRFSSDLLAQCVLSESAAGSHDLRRLLKIAAPLLGFFPKSSAEMYIAYLGIPFVSISIVKAGSRRGHCNIEIEIASINFHQLECNSLSSKEYTVFIL